MKIYIGPYKVAEINKKTSKKVVLAKGLTKEQAQEMVNNNKNPDCETVHYKQYYSDKYFITK